MDDQFSGHPQHGAWHDTDVCGTAARDADTNVCHHSNALPDSDAHSYVVILAQKENHYG